MCIECILHCRNGMGEALSRTEIRRELMEKREWKQLTLETGDYGIMIQWRTNVVNM